jgi:putative endonuclease
MFYVYVLLSFKDYKFYTGYTDNLKRRIDEHNKGLVASTKYRRPLKLVYYEWSLNKRDAESREKYLKSGMGKRYLNNRLIYYCEEIEK